MWGKSFELPWLVVALSVVHSAHSKKCDQNRLPEVRESHVKSMVIAIRYNFQEMQKREIRTFQGFLPTNEKFMRLKSKEDTLRQLCICPEPHLGLYLAGKSQKFVPNPSSVSFSLEK